MKFLSDAQIGLAVKAARQAAGWSGKVLAESSGVSATALSKIEGGKQSLSFAEASAIAHSLGIRTDHLERLAFDAEGFAEAAVSAKDRLKRDLQLLEQRFILRAVESDKIDPGQPER